MSSSKNVKLDFSDPTELLQDSAQCMSLYNDYDQHLADSNPVTVQKQNNFIIGEKGKGAALMSQLCVAYGKKDANGDDLTDVEFDFLLAEHKEVIRKLAMLGTRGRATFFGDGYVVMMRFVIFDSQKDYEKGITLGTSCSYHYNPDSSGYMILLDSPDPAVLESIKS